MFVTLRFTKDLFLLKKEEEKRVDYSEYLFKWT